MKKIYLKCSLLLFSFLFAINVASAHSNQYLDFDGVNDWDSVPNGSQLIANATAFSITGWFFDYSLSYGKGMIGFRSAAGEFYLLELNSGQMECRYKNSVGSQFDVTPVNNTIIPQVWQYFAMVYDGSTLKLYRDSSLVGSVAANGTISNTAIPFTIGKSLLGSFNFVYKGGIDEVTLWNKALTLAEIKNMMRNELTGTETGLKLYYKFNQGVPGGNNTSITKLHTEVNSPAYDADLKNFALTGLTSNFEGTLNNSFQAISFPQVPTKLTTSPPFQLNATASSGLPVSYSIVSGPATLSGGNTVTLSGAGTVSIKAEQNGNVQYDTASPVICTFDVVDPMLNYVSIDPRNPLAGDVYMPTLSAMQLAAVASIAYPSLFSVQSLQFVINAQTITAQAFPDGHFTAWWTPPGFGNYTIQITATNNFGAVSSVSVNVNVTSTITDINNVSGFSGVFLSTSSSSVIVDGSLPSYVGAFDTIIATLSVTCPAGGCEAYDRIASIDARGHDGRWIEIIRYITPFGVACSHQINIADYMSLLQGKVSFRANCGVQQTGLIFNLSFDFKEGAPPHKYSLVTEVWKAVYPFGDYTNLQPVPTYIFPFPANTAAAKLKLVSTGHGWGSSNTGNAAEFYNATHHIWVNNVNTFTQNPWNNCNPNPDGCNPQNGTWQYARSGWCPGAISKGFDYDMTSFIPVTNVSLNYILDQGYVDQCNAHYPGCVSGTASCTDCNDGYNPELNVACNMVTFFDGNPDIYLHTPGMVNQIGVSVYPNPSTGLFYMTSSRTSGKYSVDITNVLGETARQFDWNGEKTVLDFSNWVKGVYIVKVSSGTETEFRRLILQ